MVCDGALGKKLIALSLRSLEGEAGAFGSLQNCKVSVRLKNGRIRAVGVESVYQGVSKNYSKG